MSLEGIFQHRTTGRGESASKTYVIARRNGLPPNVAHEEDETVPLTDETGSLSAFLRRSAIGQDRKDENRIGSRNPGSYCDCEGSARMGDWNCRGVKPGDQGIFQ